MSNFPEIHKGAINSSLYPVPIPGEVVYGIAAIHAYRFRLPSRQGARMLFGRQAPASVALPGRLSNLSHVLPCSISAAELASNHTLLPLYTPFLNEKTRKKCENRAYEGSGLHLIVGRAASRVVRPLGMMFCPSCAAQDMVTFGRTTWHREHQADGVFFCPYHQCQLHASGIQPYAVYASAQFIVPTGCTNSQQEHILPHWVAILQEIAVHITDVLRSNTSLPGASKLQTYYVAELSFMKLYSPDGKVKWRDLYHAFTAYYPAGLLGMLGCDLDLSNGHNWLIRLCRRFRNHQHPLQHILMMMFLQKKPCSVLREAAQLAEGEPSRPPRSPHRNRIKNVQRLAHLLPIKQNEWITLIGLPRKKPMREAYGSLYGWLHRNCREWLAENRAPRESCSSRTDWLTIDRNLADQIPVIAQSICTDLGNLRRASRSSIATATGKPGWLVLDHCRLPKASKAIKECVETSDEFACRRIRLQKMKFKHVWRCRVACGISTSVARRRVVAEALKNAVKN